MSRSLLFGSDTGIYGQELYTKHGFPVHTVCVVSYPGRGEHPIELLFFNEGYPFQQRHIRPSQTGFHAYPDVVCTSPHKMTYSDERCNTIIWDSFALCDREAAVCVTYQLLPHAQNTFGQSVIQGPNTFHFIEHPFLPRIDYDVPPIWGNPNSKEGGFIYYPPEIPEPHYFHDGWRGLPSIAIAFGKSKSIEDWMETWPTPWPFWLYDGSLNGQIFKSPLRTDVFEELSSEMETDACNDQEMVDRESDNEDIYDGQWGDEDLEDEEMCDLFDSFQYFPLLPVELQRMVIEYFLDDSEIASLVCPEDADILFAKLGALAVPTAVSKNTTLTKLVNGTQFLRSCMRLGAAWYQIIGAFLIANPVITTTDGASYLRKLKLNLRDKKFDRCIEFLPEWDPDYWGENEYGFKHVPEYVDYIRNGEPVYRESVFDNSFVSAPLTTTPELLVITPSDWKACSDRHQFGGETADSGWGNSWMVQDSLRAYQKVKRLAMSVGTNGEYFWLFRSSGIDLSHLTHLHLEIPLARHSQPGTSSLERFRRHIPGDSTHGPLPNFNSSHHLCAHLGVLARNLEVLVIQGPGAKICKRLFELPWKELHTLQVTLDSRNGCWCNGIPHGVREAAHNLFLTRTDIAINVNAYIPDGDEYHKMPYSWGGQKQQAIVDYIPDVEVANRMCCLTCAWHLRCSNHPPRYAPGHRASVGFLSSLETLRENGSMAAWLRELSYIRGYHGIDPLADFQDDCGDEMGDWLRISLQPRLDYWMQPPRIPTRGLRCGIQRFRHLKWAPTNCTANCDVDRAVVHSHAVSNDIDTAANRVELWLQYDIQPEDNAGLYGVSVDEDSK